MSIAIKENAYSEENMVVFNRFSEKGVVKFSVDSPTDTSIASLYIKVTAEGYVTDNFYDDYFGFYKISQNPYSGKQLTALYSSSGSFLNIKPEPHVIDFGDVHNIDVEYTVPNGDNKTIDLNYIIMSRSVVAKSGAVTLQIPPCSREAKRDIMVASYDYYEDFPEREEDDIFVVGLEPLPPTCRFSFQLPIDITPEMSPTAKLLIYYVREDNEVIADSTQLTVVKGLLNKVSMEFEDEEKRPGEKTTLTIQSDADSLCAVGIVDKSVELMGTTNRITNDKVFNSLSTYSRGYFYYNSHKCHRGLFDEIRNSPEVLSTKTTPVRQGYTRTSYTYTTTKHLDASAVFQNAGIAFETNLDVERRPCYEITKYYWRRDYYYIKPVSVSGSVFHEDLVDIPEANLIVNSPQNEVDGIEQENIPLIIEEEKVKIRTYFPETLLWEIKRTNKDDGKAKFSLDVPDTITDWKANGFCISPESNIGISETATLRAFKPFFISMTLPYSVIRNETVPLKITVFNYLAEECLMVKINLKRSTNFTTLGNDFTRKVCVCGGGSSTVQLRIVPHTLGEIPITVTARTRGFNAATSSRFCDGEPRAANKRYVGIADGVQRDLLVEPEGVEKDVTESSIICPTDDEVEKLSFKIDFPENTVPGSARVKLQVIGDIMGPALNNLNHLIRLPTGCGEQNIVSMAPNVYVLHYLMNTGQLDENLNKTIIRNIQVGYQRELNYRRNDGSYSAFGEYDLDGSTWLTAFVLRTFAESNEFIQVDENLMTDSIGWLISQQNITTGCVMSRGQLFNKAMKGGVSDEITLTAYALITMVEAGSQSTNRYIIQATKCLVDRWNNVDSGIRNDAYSVALLTYAFKLSRDYRYNELLTQLNALAIEENGLKHWERSEDQRPKNPCYYCRAPSAEVEMTAYALLALDLNRENDQIEALKISRWLAQQQNAYGGYSSTQDTVIALKALAYFAEVLYAGGTTQMSIRATSSAAGEFQEFNIDSSNRLILQRMDIEKAPTTIDVESSGSGCALVQIQSLYNIYEKPAVEVEPFTINLETSTPDEKLSCDKQTMKLSVSYNGDDGVSSMAIVEIKLVSGYFADKESLFKLSKDTELRKLGFKRYEVKDKIVSLYFDEFTSKPITFEFDVFKEIAVKNPKPGMITVYDYYEAELKSVKPYKLCRR